MEEKLYRISYFITPNSTLICWNKFPEDILDKIPSTYFNNIYSLVNKNDIRKSTYLILEPAKKFRKDETVITIGDNISIGLDDF